MEMKYVAWGTTERLAIDGFLKFIPEGQGLHLGLAINAGRNMINTYVCVCLTKIENNLSSVTCMWHELG